MAEPNSLEWMTEQRDRLKAETDDVNKKNDALVAQANQMAGELMTLKSKVTELESELAMAKATKRIADDLIAKIRKLVATRE